MPITRSPFSRRPQQMPRQDDGWIDITTGQPASQSTGQPAPVQPVDLGGYQPIVPSSGAGSVPRVQPAAAVKDDTVTPADVQDVIQTQYQRIVDDPSVSPERKQGLIEELSTIAGGGTLPGLGLTGKVLGVAGKGIMKGLGGLTAGARAIQAGLAEPFEALGMIGSGAALDVSGAYGAAAGRGPIPESEASVDVTPVPSGGRDVFRLPSERISTRRSWQEKVKDPNYMLTVPNIRDKVNKPTGVDWVDKLINGGLFIVDAAAELTFQGLTDPLSYVTFGAGQWAGQAGRAALTARLLQDDAVRAVPSLLENPQRLYRLGEWGLKRSERQALVQAGILEPEGIAWAWGSQGVIGGTGRAARAVGGTVARGRASVGDVLAKIGPRGKGGIPALTTVGTRRNLIAAARNRGWNDAGGEARTAVLQYAGSLAARREAGITTAVLNSRYRGLLKELAESPYRNDIATLIEPGTTATTVQLPAEAQVLADLVTDAFEEMRQLYNMRMDGFRTKYGLNPDYAIDIPSIDNYFFHKVTPEMNRLIRTTKGTDKAPWISQVQDMIAIGAREMRQGGGPLRMRKLIAGEKFLDEELKTGSIAEINEIWRRKTNTDFDFFETDSAEVVASYIDSISNQAARVAYFDRLFDYGTDAIRPVLEKVIPDQALLGQAQSTLNKLNGQRQSLIRSITNAVVRGEKKAGNKLVEVAEAVLRGADDDWVKAEKAVAARQQELSNLAGQLKVLRAEADTKTANIRGAWEDMIAALELRVASIEDAISRGEGAQEAARQYLLEQHSKMFPNRKKRPSDIRQLAAEVLERRENRFASKLKALETRRSRAQRRQASAERRAERLGVEASEIAESVEGINNRTMRLRALSEINFDSEVAPDGVVYTSEQYLQDLPEGGAAVFYPEATDIPDPIAIPAADIEQTYDLSNRLDDMQRVLTALDDEAAAVIAELTGNQEYADWITVEVRRLMMSPLGTEIDPRVPEQLAPLIQTIHGWGRSAETSDEIVQTYLAAMIDAVDIALADAVEPIDPDSVIAIVDDMIRGAASIDAGPEAARVMVSIPDIQLGGTKILMDPTETWNIYSGATDNVFAGIADGTLAWDDVVPQRTVIEPTAAAAPTPAAVAPEPTPTPAPAVSGGPSATVIDGWEIKPVDPDNRISGTVPKGNRSRVFKPTKSDVAARPLLWQPLEGGDGKHYWTNSYVWVDTRKLPKVKVGYADPPYADNGPNLSSLRSQAQEMTDELNVVGTISKDGENYVVLTDASGWTTVVQARYFDGLVQDDNSLRFFRDKQGRNNYQISVKNSKQEVVGGIMPVNGPPKDAAVEWVESTGAGVPSWSRVAPPPAAAAPTPAPSAAPAVRQTLEATTDETTKDALGRGVWVSGRNRAEAITELIADAKKAEKAGTINEFLSRLDDVTDIGDKAELVKRALAAGRGASRSPFFAEVLDRFQMEVEFAVGRAAAGIGTDNFSRNVQQAASADPELFLRYTAEAAQSAGVKKPESWAKIPKAERDQLDAAVGQPAAAAAPEPVAAVEPTTQVTSTPLDAEMRLVEEREQLIARGQQIDPELEAAARADTEARAAAAAAGREIGTLRGAETRARQAIESRVDVARGRERVDIGTGEPVTRGKAGQELRAEQRKLNKARSDMEREIQSDPVFKSIKQTERKVEAAATRFDAAEAAFASKDDWQQSVRPLYEKEIKDIRDALNSAPPAGAARQGATEWANRVQGVLDNLQTVQFTDNQREAWDRVFTQLFGLEADLAKLEANIVIQQNVVKNIANSNMGGKVVKDILDGWIEIERLGVQIPRELYDEMTLGVRKLQDPKEWNAFVKSYLEYQRFFKAYAISTPGFIVRNAMTAAFNNLVAGITPLQQARTFKFAREYYRNGLDAAFDSLSAADRPIFEEAFRAVVGSGGGQAIDEVMPLIRGKSSRIYNNAYTRWFQKRNEQAEIWGRMAMAIDGVERGFTLDQNSARIIRYHFDYSDTSRLDEAAKLVIPFWTFASRNMSLQIINQFARPGMYQRYNDLRELTEGRASDYQLWPVWLREREPLQLGDGRYLNPDLPQIDLQQQLEQLLVPQRLLGQSNPLIRTTVEGLTQKSLAFDTPFGTKTEKAGVTDIPSIVLTELAGLTGADVSGERTDDGYQIGRFAQSVGPGLLPPLQQLQRYLKSGLGAAGQGPESPVQQAIGGSSRYAERDFWTTLGTYLGIPYGQLTPEQIQGELRRMQYAAKGVGR